MGGVVAGGAAKDLIPLCFGVDALSAIRFESVVCVIKVFKRSIADPIVEVVDKASGRENGEILGELFAQSIRQPFGADAVIDGSEFFGAKAGDPRGVGEFKVACLFYKRRNLGSFFLFSFSHNFLSNPLRGAGLFILESVSVQVSGSQEGPFAVRGGNYRIKDKGSREEKWES